MTERAVQRHEFLKAADLARTEIAQIAGDASNRSYYRIRASADRSYILMDAPPGTGEDVAPFISIAEHLAGIGLSAPAILAQDASAGFLLLEDLGDDLFARLLMRRPDLEPELYSAAVDVLAIVRAASPPDCPTYAIGPMLERASLAEEWYGTGQTGLISPVLETVLNALDTNWALALRDYHAENLIWLPDREGAARVGLLDFQDASVAPGAYDLVSLLQDARRDLGKGISSSCKARFAGLTGADEGMLDFELAALGAQRNLRILGVFARLAKAYGKPRYLDLIPRVWRHLMDNLRHPDLRILRSAVLECLPEPSELHLRTLRPK